MNFSVLQMEVLVGIGAFALMLAWVSVVAPWIARVTAARLRASAAADVEAMRETQFDQLMPTILSQRAHRIALWILGCAWGIGFFGLWLTVGISSGESWAYTAFFAMLLLLSLVDLDTQILPPVLVGAALWAGLLAATIDIVQLAPNRAIFGVIVGWLFLSVPNWAIALFRHSDQPTVGGGDVSLLAACGAWLGPSPIILAGCIATVAALAIRCAIALTHRRASGTDENSRPSPPSYLPFGPVISLSVIVVFCADPHQFF